MAVHPGAGAALRALDKIVELYMDTYGVSRTEAKRMIRADLREVH